MHQLIDWIEEDRNFHAEHITTEVNFSAILFDKINHGDKIRPTLFGLCAQKPAWVCHLIEKNLCLLSP